jgi:hypothetical protein
MLWRITGLSDFSAFMQKGHEESMWSVAEGCRTQFFDMPQLHAFGRDTYIQLLSSFPDNGNRYQETKNFVLRLSSSATVRVSQQSRSVWIAALNAAAQ